MQIHPSLLVYCVDQSCSLLPTLAHQLLQLPVELHQMSPGCTVFDSYMLIKPRLRDKNVYQIVYVYIGDSWETCKWHCHMLLKS